MITRKHKILKLCCYDFDGTLMDTPEPEWGKPMWKEKTGEEYPHKGWWGRRESLNTDVFEINPFPSILSLLKKDMSDPETMTIILTSRLERLRPQVENIMRLNNIHVDDLIMKRGEADKGDEIMKLVQQNPELEHIVVYDDFAGAKENKLAEYTKIENQLPENVQYDIFYVDEGNTTLVESTNPVLSIIREEIIKSK
jgi:hypothetical protein